MTVRSILPASLLFFAAASLASTAAYAQDSKPWSLGLKAGVSYDDNVTIQQLDVKSGQGDTIGNFELAAGYNLLDTKTNKLEVTYDFSQSLHETLTNFDIQSHSIGFSGSTDLNGVSLGYAYSFYHLLLGGKSFLDMHVVNPSISTFVLPNVLVRGSYFYYDKSFYTATARDATQHQPDVTAFYFFNQSKAYVSLGAHYEIEDTVAPEFDYKGYALSANLQLPVDLGSREVKFNAGYTYLHRNYDNITPSIGVKRFENRSTFRVAAETPLVDALDVTVDYRYIDRHSNLASSNYKENVVSGMLGYKL